MLLYTQGCVIKLPELAGKGVYEVVIQSKDPD